MAQTIIYKHSSPEPRYSPTEEAVLSVLAYFDIFQYPVTIGEIEQYRKKDTNSGELHSAVDSLLRKQKLFRVGDFYCLQDNPLLAYRREEGNKKATELIKQAIKKGRFLQRFPFVKAVGISGSLSKNYAGPQADFDFFIITTGNRLWIARTFLHLFKKITILLGKHRYYCMNYFIDEKALQLSDRNIFSAIELKTLIPVAGERVLKQFINVNPWADEFLPYCKPRVQEYSEPHRPPVKKIMEYLLHFNWGNRIDDYLYRLTTRRWKKKEEKGQRNEKGELMRLITGKHFSKSDAGDFQAKVLSAFNERLRDLDLN
jgi:hypothetical protein